MRYLLDENVSESIAPAMQAIGLPQEMFSHVLAEAGREGLDDDEVVELCAERRFDVLITLNVRDFGAKKHYYAALNDRGIHVVVGRPGKSQPDLGQQLALIAAQFDHVRMVLTRAQAPTLVRLTRTSAQERTLQQLLSEISGLP